MAKSPENDENESITAPTEIPQAVLEDLGRGLHTRFEAYCRDVIALATNLGVREGIDGSYVLFVLTRQSSGWPPLRATDREALEITARLLGGYGLLPGDGTLEMPSMHEEYRVDRTLRRLSEIARSTVIPELKRIYLAEVDVHTRQLISDPDLRDGSPDISDIGVTMTLTLMEAFEAWLCGDSTLASRRTMAAILDRIFA